MIYLDNSASSFTKPSEVISAVNCACKFFTANPGRSAHTPSIRGARLIESARSEVSKYIGLSDGNIIFTDNCTGALNLAVLGLKRRKRHIVTTIFEHNALLRPLYHLEKLGLASISFATPSNGLTLSASDIISHIRPDTSLVAVGHISNLTGSVAPICAVGSECRRRGITFLVDGAQSVGHCEVDMDKNNIDLLAFAPHKSLRSITGVGVLAVRSGVNLSPIKFGGTGYASALKEQPSDFPDGFEAGTQSTVSICALLGAIKRKKIYGESERAKTAELGRYFYEKLNLIEGVRIYCDTPSSAIISFNIDGIDSEKVSEILSSEYGICTRAGLHCAPLIHSFLGTLNRGAVRVSIGCDNDKSELDFTLRAIDEIASLR